MFGVEGGGTIFRNSEVFCQVECSIVINSPCSIYTSGPLQDDRHQSFDVRFIDA
jgi:hypothetical protein